MFEAPWQSTAVEAVKAEGCSGSEAHARRKSRQESQKGRQAESGSVGS